MIEPTDADIGRGVNYIIPNLPTETGVITSFNEHYVFVRYRDQHPSANGKATHRMDLYWETES